MNRIHATFIGLKGACLAVVILAVPASAQYVVTELGSLGGTQVTPVAINNLGQVAGTSQIAGNAARHAFRTAPDSPINPATDDLGTLGRTNSDGNSINDLGQVAGSSSIAGGASRAFRSSANNQPVSLTDLGTFSGVSNSFGLGINNLGQVAGQSHVTTPPCGLFSNPAFRTGPATTIPGGDNLGTLLGGCRSATAWGVNDAGQVVGTSAAQNIFSPANHAFRAAPGGPMIDLHPPFNVISSSARAINNNGQVIGTIVNLLGYRTPPNPAVIVGAVDGLGNLGGGYCDPQGINDAGQVVGMSLTGGFALHAFLYSNGVMTDLNNMIGANSGYELTIACDINESGQIVASARKNGVSRAVRLDPRGVAFSNLSSLIANPATGLDAGSVYSLTSQLDAASASIQRGQRGAALNQLSAVLNHINALETTSRLSSSNADALRTGVTNVMQSL